MTDDDPLLDVRGLSGAVIAIDRLSLAAGGAVAVMGPSGAGKSQLLRAIADLDPNEGAVTLKGEARENFSAPEWRRRVMYVAPEPAWWAETVAEHFDAANGARPDEVAGNQRATGLARDFKLPADVFRWPVARLSSGEGQRLALMRAILRRPRVLLLDEPTATLDKASAEAVEEELKAFMGHGGAIVIVTHDPAQAERLNAAVIRLRGGRVVEAEGVS